MKYRKLHTYWFYDRSTDLTRWTIGWSHIISYYNTRKWIENELILALVKSATCLEIKYSDASAKNKASSWFQLPRSVLAVEGNLHVVAYRFVWEWKITTDCPKNTGRTSYPQIWAPLDVGNSFTPYMKLSQDRFQFGVTLRNSTS